MKQQKMKYYYVRYEGKEIAAKREIPYEVRLSTRLLLDEMCFNWNKQKLEAAINSSIETGDKEKFLKLSKEYRHFIWE